MPLGYWANLATADRDQSQETQSIVNQRFSASAEYWEQLYTEATVYGVIHQERHRRALQWIDKLGLPEGSHVLEVGCGAGLLAADLFRRGFVVDCIDSSDVMVALARARLATLDDRGWTTVSEGDVHSLEFADSCDLIIALGVLPFLHSPTIALKEIARVLRPGGRFLLSSDNPYRLTHLIDPRLTPLLAPGKRLVKLIARRYGWGRHRMTARALPYQTLAELLRRAGSETRQRASLGFGPFTLFARRILHEGAAVAVHRRLQAMADHGTPILSVTGAQHLVLATRTATRRLADDLSSA
jgi:SAM-dependent methyltransferase